jgi:hypothetical protein
LTAFRTLTDVGVDARVREGDSPVMDVWEYEIPKYDGDLRCPNCFLPLEAKTCVTDVFKTQSTKQADDSRHLPGDYAAPGGESNALHRFAEAFYCRKIVF